MEGFEEETRLRGIGGMGWRSGREGEISYVERVNGLFENLLSMAPATSGYLLKFGKD